MSHRPDAAESPRQHSELWKQPVVARQRGFLKVAEQWLFPSRVVAGERTDGPVRGALQRP